MNPSEERTRLRRYVLGTLTDEESAAIERAYFDRADVLDRVTAAEDDLIDDYLSGDLGGDEYARFQRDYLRTPRHRMRVDVVRALKRAAPRAGTEPNRRLGAWAALAAAAALVAAAGAVWIVNRSSPRHPPSQASFGNAPANTTPVAPPVGDPGEPGRSGGAAPPPASPIVVAFSIGPISVRAEGKGPVLAIPAGAELVRLTMEGDAGERPLERGTAIVRTVSGDEIWRGAAAGGGTRPSTLAAIEIPAAHLPPNDYIVTLRSAGARGREVERHRYVLRVRSP